MTTEHVAVILSLEGTHQASCRCGWEGGRHLQVSGAQDDIKEHFEVVRMVDELVAKVLGFIAATGVKW